MMRAMGKGNGGLYKSSFNEDGKEDGVMNFYIISRNAFLGSSPFLFILNILVSCKMKTLVLCTARVVVGLALAGTLIYMYTWKYSGAGLVAWEGNGKGMASALKYAMFLL